jgi:hypothetical protein
LFEYQQLKICLLITDGVGFRNFVLGRFLPTMEALGVDWHIISGLSAQALQQYSPYPITDERITEAPVYTETKKAAWWRKVAEVAHLSHFSTYGMNYNLLNGRPKGSSARAWFRKVQYAIGEWGGKLNAMSTFEQLHHKAASQHALVAHYVDYFRKQKPDLLFVTHQRPPQIVPIVLAAQQLGIPVASFIFSWDNLASKGRTPVRFDHLLVWSQLMKDEALHFYPDMTARQVSIVGTPQFEPYVYEQYGYTETDFRAKVGLHTPKERKLLCFSCGDVSTSPNDGEYIALIAEASRRGEWGQPVDLLVRTSPAESPERFAALRARYPEIVWNVPEWVQTRPQHPEPWSQRVPTLADIHLLKSLVQYSDLNVNMCSTMTLDFAVADCPVVNVGWGGIGAYAHWGKDHMFYQFEHYAHIVRSGGAYITHTPQEMLAGIGRALANRQEKSTQRAAMLQMEVGAPLQGTSERMVEILKQIAAHG